jgi:hypothetical protein
MALVVVGDGLLAVALGVGVAWSRPAVGGAPGEADSQGLNIPPTLRDQIRESDPLFLVVVWLPVFLVIELAGLGLALVVHGSGFDDCEPGAQPGSTAVQVVIAVAAVALPVALAAWRVKGPLLLAALAPVAAAGGFWWLLLSSVQTC